MLISSAQHGLLGNCQLFEAGVYSGSGVKSEKKLLRVLRMSNFLQE